MDEKKINVQNLSNEELLSIYDTIENHLKYLKDQMITLEDENESDGGEENE